MENWRMDEFVLSKDPLLASVQQLLSGPDEQEKSANSTAVGTYARDRSAMARTAVDVMEFSRAYVFLVDMPGVKASDIKVQIENDNVLSINGERKLQVQMENETEAKYLRLERGPCRFMRKFSLPANAKLDGISAAFTDGVLTLIIPKVPPPQPKLISVNST